ncbi:conserved hypothetical protein [Paracholeplasma brassicae]|uniref:Uncharacterized protein n=1 Tax=Acholeplasma brassicae TaxID=61635 RepID=U4KSW8_9MOLU|nr:hypothetical protein [Paracholeplasma brassicae]CCV65664.1 conserved hypothetical protein [Paracholeplasma brassicae]
MPIYRTAENAKDPKIVTRWYQSDYKEVSNAVLSVTKQFGFNLLHQDDQFGEFILEKKQATLDVKIISMNRRETAVDFTLNVANIFDFGRSKTMIFEMYQRLGKMLTEKKR